MLTPAQERFAAQQRVARLATADAHGQPHLVPVCFAYLGGRFYMPVDEKPKRGKALRRLRNIAQNPQVALLLDVYDDDWHRLHWLMVEGEARVLTGGPEYGAAVAALKARYPQYEAMGLGLHAIICVMPRRVLEWRWA
jgi:PPOX class probable F420-dependent enzyme